MRTPSSNRNNSNSASAPGATELLSAPTNGGRVSVTVFGTRSTLFTTLVDSMYNVIEGYWTDTTRLEMPVTEDEFRTYCFMAARTRIAWINDERRHDWPLRPKDDWVLPSQIANVINSVGKVFVEETATLLVPVWPVATAEEELEPNLDSEALLLSVNENRAFDITLRMRRIHSHFERIQGVPVVFVDHIASEKEGDPDVMCLVPSYAGPMSALNREEPVRLHARAASDRIVNGTVAFNYLAWALLPSVYLTNHVGLHPLENPGGRFIESQAVYATWMRLLAKTGA